MKSEQVEYIVEYWRVGEERGGEGLMNAKKQYP